MEGLKKNSTNWISIYLFFEGNYYVFLQNYFIPFVRQAFPKNTPLFFFVRYNEGGSHLRLRIKTNNPGKYSFLVHSYFKDQIPKVPGQCITKIMDTIYYPEIERYGGVNAIGISERQFDLTSRIVLKLITKTKTDYCYDSCLGYAIQLQLALVHSAGCTRIEAKKIFYNYQLTWQYSILSPNEIQAHDKDELETICDERFSKQMKSDGFKIELIIRRFWESLKHPQKISPFVLKQWYMNSKKNIAEMNELQQCKKLFLAKKTVNGLIPYHIIIEDYIHMTNNRLGISNNDEAYLAYLLSKSL